MGFAARVLDGQVWKRADGGAFRPSLNFFQVEKCFFARWIYGDAESRNVVIEDVVTLLRRRDVFESLLSEVQFYRGITLGGKTGLFASISVSATR